MPTVTARRGRAVIGLRIALVVYIVLVAAIAFFPTPVDRPVDRVLFRVLYWLSQHGLPFVTYRVVEFGANIAFFIPLGFLLALLLGRRRWWLAIVICVLATSAVELSQTLLMPHRVGSIADIVANSSGGMIGALVARIAMFFHYRRHAG